MEHVNQLQKDYNEVIDFAINKAGAECAHFLKAWQEGDFDTLEREFGFHLSERIDTSPDTTTVVVTYSNGETREFRASDDLEKMINEGHMFSISTMHSDINREEEMSVSKMYCGNPIAAMGYMMMMKRNAELMDDDEENHKDVVIEVLNTCIKFISDEVTSHQSGMMPIDDEAGIPHLEVVKDVYRKSVDKCQCKDDDGKPLNQCDECPR